MARKYFLTDEDKIIVTSDYNSTGIDAVNGQAIAEAINALDKTDAAENGKYVSEVSEVDGKIEVKREAFPTHVSDDIEKPKYATEGQVLQFDGNNWKGANLPNVPTKLSELENDGDGDNPFLTEHQDLTGYAKTELLDAKIDKPDTASEGQILTFDGENWVAKTINQDSNDDITLIPAMTSNTTPEGEVKASNTHSSIGAPWKAFNDTNIDFNDGWVTSDYHFENEWIQYKFSNAQIANKIYIENRNDFSNQVCRPIKDFELYAGDTEDNLTLLGSFTNNNILCHGGSFFTFKNSNAYLIYRLVILSTNDPDNKHVGFGKIQLYKENKKRFLLSDLEDVDISSPSKGQIFTYDGDKWIAKNPQVGEGADGNTTYTLVQDEEDGHKLTFTPSDGAPIEIIIPDNNTTYEIATQESDGLMSKEDKTKLDNIDSIFNNLSYYDTSKLFVNNDSLITRNSLDELVYTSNNYLYISKPFRPKNSSWEINICFKANSVKNSSTILGVGETYKMPAVIEFQVVDGKNYIHAYIADSNNSYPIRMKTTTDIHIDVKYWIKLKYDGDSYILLLSTDGITFNEEQKIESSIVIADDENSILYLGSCYLNTYFNFNGTIYISNSYIKINDEIWWGAFNIINNNYTAGEGITISENNVISSENTTYSFSEGTVNGSFSVVPSNGVATNVKIHGLGSLAYSNSTIPDPVKCNGINLTTITASSENSNTISQNSILASGQLHIVYEV